jgi:hypothetical protein
MQRVDVFEWIAAVATQLPRLNDLQIEAVVRTYVANSSNTEATLESDAPWSTQDFGERVVNA